MNKLATRFHKKIFPVIFGTFCAVITIVSGLGDKTSLYIIIPASLFAGLLFFGVAKAYASQYVDEVIFKGDIVVVRNHGLEESISLSDISDVERFTLGPRGVILHFRRHTLFGDSIKFLPSISDFGLNDYIRKLRSKVAQAKQSTA